MLAVEDADRRERLGQLEDTITHPRSVLNVDCLLVSVPSYFNSLKSYAKTYNTFCFHIPGYCTSFGSGLRSPTFKAK